MLIQDTIPFKILRHDRVVSEDVNGKRRPVLRIGGQFQLGNKPNANGRIYPMPVLEEAVGSLQEAINKRQVLGEFDHPPDAKIHLDRVSHLITKLWIENNTVFGEAEVLEDTDCGRQLKALLESKVSIGISSRGVGDMETTIHEGEEYYQVMPGYSFVTFDMVAEPSVHGSYMNILGNNTKSSKSVKVVRVAESINRENLVHTREQQEKLIIVEARNLLKGLL